MKRFDFFTDAGTPLQGQPSETGLWIRYREAQAEIMVQTNTARAHATKIHELRNELTALRLERDAMRREAQGLPA